jgi:ribosomal protein S18 acetylase RimI-like enzyme
MYKQYKLQKFNRSIHNRSNFDCKVEELNIYLKEKAGQEQDKHVSAIYIVTEKDNNAIIGYFTVSAGALKFHNLPEAMQRKLPKYEQIPIALLGRLAVDKHYQGIGLGKYLLVQALKKIYTHSTFIAIYAAVVDSKNEKTKNFYQKFGFKELNENGRKLFLPISSIEKLIISNK